MFQRGEIVLDWKVTVLVIIQGEISFLTKFFKKSRYFPVHKLVTILPNFPIILNGLRLPGSGTFTFPPATRFNIKVKKNKMEDWSFRRQQLINSSFLPFYGPLLMFLNLGPWFLFESFEIIIFQRRPLISLIKV